MKGWCCCDIPWEISSCQDVLRYFIGPLLYLIWLCDNFPRKALNSECLLELPTESCNSGSCLKYLLLSCDRKIKVCFILELKCGESHWSCRRELNLLTERMISLPFLPTSAVAWLLLWKYFLLFEQHSY